MVKPNAFIAGTVGPWAARPQTARTLKIHIQGSKEISFIKREISAGILNPTFGLKSDHISVVHASVIEILQVVGQQEILCLHYILTNSKYASSEQKIYRSK